MPGFWVDPQDVGEAQLILRGDEAHHLTRVRRYGPGDEIEAVDGAGCCYRTRIEQVADGEVAAAIVERWPEKGESPVRLHLAPALIKGQRFDFVVEKAVEVGVASLRPLLTERGIARLGSERKFERWQRLARAATKQCGRSRMPAVAGPRSLDEVLADLARECDAVWMATPDAAAVPLATLARAHAVKNLGLLIGPEGGFSGAEVKAAIAAGGRTFTWGERVLRADTASVVLAALALHHCEEAIT